MRTKKLVLTGILLLFLLSLTLLILNPQTPPPTIINTQKDQTQPKFQGTGNQLNATLQVTNNINTTPEPTSVDTDFHLNCPQNWNLTYAHLNFTNINAPNHTKNVETDPRYTYLSLDKETAMSFTISNDAYLDVVSLYLNVLISSRIFFTVRNSSTDGKPDHVIEYFDTDVEGTAGYTWVNISLNHIPLILDQTFSNKFYITARYANPTNIPSWGAVEDGEFPGDNDDEGDAYQYTVQWELKTVDLIMKLYLSASSEPQYTTPKPSEINLEINGTEVLGDNKGEGYWILPTNITSSTGSIFFDITSTWMETVTLTITFRNTTLVKQTIASTNFAVNSDGCAFWNITVHATGDDSFPASNGTNYIIVSGIPPDWGDSSSKAYNQTGDSWVDLVSHPPSDVVFPASNGTWIVNCTAPNYVSGISFGVDGEPVENATLYDLLEINILFNTSLRSNVTGTVNLTIYDPDQILNYTDEKVVDQAIGTLFSWDVGSTANSTGTYNVTVSFHDGFVVGYNESQLSVVALVATSLTVTSYPSDIEYPGPVPIMLYYSRTDTGQGLHGADIAAYFVNGTPATIVGSVIDHGNGSYSFNLDFGTDFGVHNVYFNASGLRLFKAGGSDVIQINYTKILVGVTVGFEVGGVPVENATLYEDLNITVTFSTTVSGSVNLKIYDPSQVLNHTEEKAVSSATSTWFIWHVGDTANSTGPYNVTVSLDGALVVGYVEATLDIVPLTSTSLIVTSYPSNSVEYPGPIPVTIFYSGDGQGLAGATVSAYFGNGTPATVLSSNDYGNGSYTLNLDFGKDFGVFELYFNARGLRLFESSNSILIQINYTKVFVKITLDTPRSVVLNTMLVATTTLFYATNNSAFAGQTVYFNFSLRFTNGSSTVIQRNSLINYDGRAEASIVVPLDTVELNVTAFYNGTSTVFGVVSSTNSVALTSETIGSPPLMVFSSLMLLVAVQQSQNFPLYILIGASVAAVAVAASRARRMILTPQRALASLENIIVDHIATGATLWFYDFLTLGQDVALVSGFMSAVKSFMGEMQKGGLKRLGTEFGTLIREEGQQIAVTLIVGRVGAAEENWLRRKMVRFISLVEGELASELTDWRGDIAVFKEKLPLLLGVVTDLERVKKLQGMRVEALKRERAQLKKQLNDIGSRLEQWREQFESGKLTLEEYQKIQKEWEPEYSRVQEQYIHTQLVLQRFPPDLSDREKAKKLGQIKNDFFRIQGEIDELSRKYEAGRMSKRDLKKRDELSRRLNSLLKELEKYDTNMSG